MRDARAQALAAGATSAQAGHLGRKAGLVDEHQAGRVEIELPVKPRFTRDEDVGPVLLGCVCGFLNVIARVAKKRQMVPTPADTLFSSANRACISFKLMCGGSATRSST